MKSNERGKCVRYLQSDPNPFASTNADKCERVPVRAQRGILSSLGRFHLGLLLDRYVLHQNLLRVQGLDAARIGIWRGVGALELQERDGAPGEQAASSATRGTVGRLATVRLDGSPARATSSPMQLRFRRLSSQKPGVEGEGGEATVPPSWSPSFWQLRAIGIFRPRGARFPHLSRQLPRHPRQAEIAASTYTEVRRRGVLARRRPSHLPPAMSSNPAPACLSAYPPGRGKLTPSISHRPKSPWTQLYTAPPVLPRALHNPREYYRSYPSRSGPIQNASEVALEKGPNSFLHFGLPFAVVSPLSYRCVRSHSPEV